MGLGAEGNSNPDASYPLKTILLQQLMHNEHKYFLELGEMNQSTNTNMRLVQK